MTCNRRNVLMGSAAITSTLALGMPSITRAQASKVVIGHLTPLTGFLGTLGSYAQLGIRLAVDEINRAGGIMGRRIELISEDSVNPEVAATKAQRMIERDGAVMLMGEINSESALAIMQVAQRNKRVFISTSAKSDALRGKHCSRYSFHCDMPNTVMVNAIGTALLGQNMVKGKKFFALTADYIFGHDLLKAAKAFFAVHDANLVGDELIATNVIDFSTYLAKIRQASPDVVYCNLAGNQVPNLVKKYAELGLPYPLVVFNLSTAIWPGAEQVAVIGGDGWAPGLDTPASHAFVATFSKRYGKPPEKHAWIEYCSLKMLAQAISETKTTDSDALIAYLEKETQFDIMKARKAYFRSWDHQLVQEAYTFTIKTKTEAKDQWDMLKLGPAVPAANAPLDSIFPTKEQNPCTK